MNIARVFSGVLKQERTEFDALVQRHHRQAYNVAYRMTGNRSDAEDLTQETFLRAFRFFDRYNREMPFDNWLYRIMTRVFIDTLRRRPKIKSLSLDAPLNSGDSGDSDVFLEVPDYEADPERMMLTDSLDEPLQRALVALPEEFRLAVILADIEGLSYEEIAEVMGCTVGTVRSRLHRGRKRLRESFRQ